MGIFSDVYRSLKQRDYTPLETPEEWITRQREKGDWFFCPAFSAQMTRAMCDTVRSGQIASSTGGGAYTQTREDAWKCKEQCDGLVRVE